MGKSVAEDRGYAQTDFQNLKDLVNLKCQVRGFWRETNESVKPFSRASLGSNIASDVHNLLYACDLRRLIVLRCS